MDPRRYLLQQAGWNNSSGLAGYDPLILSNLRREAVLGTRGYLDTAFQQEAVLGRLHPSSVLFERDRLQTHYPALGLLPPTQRLTLEEEVAIIRETQRREQENQFALLEREREALRHEQEREFALLKSDRERLLEHEFENFRRHYRYNRASSEENEDEHEYQHSAGASRNSREKSQNADRKISRWHDSDSDQETVRREKIRSPRRGRGQIRSRRMEREWSSDRERRHERSLSCSDNDREDRPHSPQSNNKRHREHSHEEISHDHNREKNDHEGTRYFQRPDLLPSSTLVVKGLSKETVEDDLYQALSEWGPVKDIRVIKDKSSGLSRGFAFIEFPSVDGAQKMVKGIGTDGLLVNGRRLFFEYSKRTGGVAASQSGQGGNTTREVTSVSSKNVVAPPTDWMCVVCGCVNFARRAVCFQCNEGRIEDVPAGDATLSALPSAPPSSTNKNSGPGPTNVLVVRGLDGDVEEEILRFEFSKHAPVKDLRLVRDKFTHVSRGFAFVHFHSVDDASKALEGSNGMKLEKNGQILKVAFAKSSSNSGPSQGNSRANTAIEAATFAQQYTSFGWAPKEYQPEVGNNTDKGEAGSSTRGISQLNGTNQQTVAGSDTNTSIHSGFVWDEASGYYYDAASGFYYDGHRGLYYDGNNGIWYSYNQETQQYVALAEFRTASEIANDILKTQKGSRDTSGEKATVQSKAVISAPACTITLENDINEKKSKLAESVAAAVNSARAAAAKEKANVKEKLKELRLAGKNPGMGSKKPVNVVSTKKQWKTEDPGLSSRVGNASTATTAADSKVDLGEGVSKFTITKSNGISNSGNTVGDCHQLSEISGKIMESNVSKGIRGIIRESVRCTTKNVDTSAVLGSSVVSNSTSCSSDLIGITNPSEITGEPKMAVGSKKIMGVIRESGRIRSINVNVMPGSSTISQSTTSLSESSEGIEDYGSIKTIAGVIREFGRGTKSMDNGRALGSSSMLPDTITSLVSTGSKLSEVSGRDTEVGISKPITGVIRESTRSRTSSLGTGEMSLSTIPQLTMSTPFKTPAAALVSHGSMAGAKRKFTETLEPVSPEKVTEGHNFYGPLQPSEPKSALDFMRKDVKFGGAYDINMQYRRSFGEQSVQAFTGLASTETKPFATMDREQALIKMNDARYMSQNLSYQEGSVLGREWQPFQPEKMGERVGFW